MKWKRSLLILFILGLSYFYLEQISEVRAFYFHVQSLLGYKLKNTSQILMNSIRANQENSNSSILQNNLGLSYDLTNNIADAIKTYKSSELLSKDPNFKFIFRFNEGEAWGRQKKIDEALRAYQSALELNPNSLEVKTNIELLIQQQQQQNSQGQGESNSDEKQQDGKEDNKEKDQNKEFQKNKKYKPREFSNENLPESAVNKILEELKKQEQKTQKDFNKGQEQGENGERKNSKDQLPEKSW